MQVVLASQCEVCGAGVLASQCEVCGAGSVSITV